MAAPWREEWIEYAKTLGDPPALPENNAEEMSNLFNAFMVSAVSHLPPSDPNIQTEDFAIPQVCKARLYRPTVSANEPLPLIIFVHGGGFFAGNLDTEDYTCRTLCSGTPSLVLSLEYETGWALPISHSIDDCYNATLWAHAHASTLDADPNKFVIVGGSAGAAIATATVYKLVQNGHGDKITGFVSMNGLHCHPGAVPSAYSHLMNSYATNSGTLPFVSGHHTLLRYEVLKMQPPDTDYKLFPTAGGPEYLRAFPRTYIMTSENDASRDDGTVFEAELNDAGVKTELYCFEGLAHYFWHFPLKQAGKEFREKLAQGVRWTLER